MSLTVARKKANAKYEAKAYDKTLIRLHKGRLDEIRAYIERTGESLNGFINRAIMQAMDRDGIEIPPVCKKEEAKAGIGADEVIKEFLPKGPVDLLNEVRESAQDYVRDMEETRIKVMGALCDMEKEKDSRTPQLRLCRVSGKPGYFHTWETYSRPIGEKPFKADDPAGTFSRVYGIVEFSDGVRRVDPEEILFRDETNATLRAGEEGKEG